ncbi:MAG: helix-turn-helix domain-containing protein [Pseudonocardiaceae bacterium]
MSFLLTHEFLAQMLSLRRPTVSEIAHRLQEQGLIRYRRGMVTITDRAGMERKTCPCYQIVKTELERVAQGQ